MNPQETGNRKIPDREEKEPADIKHGMKRGIPQ